MKQIEYEHFVLTSERDSRFPLYNVRITKIKSKNSDYTYQFDTYIDDIEAALESIGPSLIEDEKRWLANNRIDWWEEEYYG